MYLIPNDKKTATIGRKIKIAINFLHSKISLSAVSYFFSEKETIQEIISKSITTGYKAPK